MDWESFYDTHPSPSHYESTITAVENFVVSHENEKIVLVTVSILTYYKYYLSVKLLKNYNLLKQFFAQVLLIR